MSKKDKKQKKTIVESDIEYKSVEEKPTEKASAEEKNKSVDQKKKNKKKNQQVNFLGPIKKPRIYVTVNDIKGLYGVSDAFL